MAAQSARAVQGDPAPAPRSGSAAAEAPAASRPLPWWPAVLAAAVTGAVAFWGISVPQYWFDEAATVSATDRPFGSLLRLLRDVDAVHALYYIVMQPWVAVFGVSETAMRAPSALALTFAALLLTRVAMAYARRWFPQRIVATGLSAGLVFAVLPGISWSGQEARGYAMAVFASVAALWFFERFREKGGPGNLVGFALLQACAIGFSLYAASAVVLYVVRAATWGRRPFLQVLAAAAAIAVAVIPLGLLAMSQSKQVGWIDLTVREVVERGLLSTVPISPVNRGGPMGAVAAELAPWLMVLIVLILAAGLVRGPGRRAILWTLAFPVLPLASVLVAQLLGMQLFQERYFTYALPFLVLALALSLAAVRWLPAIVLLTAAVLLLSLPSLLGQNTYDAKRADNYQDAAELVEQADTAIFMDRAARAVLIAYPPEHEIADPMLQEDRVSADNLYGLNRPGYESWEIDTVGPTAVVSNKKNGYHEAVLSNLAKNGCTVTDRDTDTRFRITLLDCPDPAAG